jgi:hypothetical protein
MSLTIGPYTMRARSASVVSAKNRRAIVSSPSIASRRLLGNPGAVDPPMSNQTCRGLDLRAGAATEPLEHPATDLERLLWLDAHIDAESADHSFGSFVGDEFGDRFFTGDPERH